MNWTSQETDCFGVNTPRNDGEYFETSLRTKCNGVWQSQNFGTKTIFELRKKQIVLALTRRAMTENILKRHCERNAVEWSNLKIIEWKHYL